MLYPKDDNTSKSMTKWERKEATLFAGFCEYHNNEFFKPIENNDFNKNDEHIFKEYKSQLLELADDDRVKYLNNLKPMKAENIAINPSAWDLQEEYQKDEFWHVYVGYE
ncbi:hypothetical protein KQI42_17475 [Tissierella sp. MSJ-40]|uniref:Uncharacterized protein n=1 Tax=Tissierella simiarum TaxID=2841534 RepID=A0ABS6EBJ7_9FIRM|nr:hypothetical protein [Tissierella simiarum]MBU5439810.1 hypothetical protein [Tissierella simiarum]